MNGNFELKDSFYLLMQTKSGDTLLGMGWEDVNAEGKTVRTLEWLDRLEITMPKGTVDTDFFDRLLEHAIDASAETFTYFKSEEIPGYLIVGFESMEAKAAHHDNFWSTVIASPSHDMGFAVFQMNDERTGYKLIDYYLYEDAVADNGNLIYFAGPAVADMNGVITDENAYDVIFCIDDRVKSVVRVLDDGTEIKQGVEKMTLLHWEDTKNSKTVKMYYLDEDGNVVSDYEKETDSGSVKNLNPEAFYYIIHLFENADWKDGVEDNAADFVIGGLQDKNVLYYISILDGYRTAEGEVVLLYNEMDYSDDGSYLFKKGQYIVTLRPAEEGAGVEYWIVSNLPYEK